MCGDAGAPVADTLTRVEFRFSNPEYPFANVSAEHSCIARLEQIVPRDEGYAEFFTFTGTDVQHVFDAVSETERVEATLLASERRSGLFEFHVRTDACPAVFLAEAGALPRRLYGEGDTAKMVVDIPEPADPAAVIGEFLASHETAELVAKRQQSGDEPVFGTWELQRVIKNRLTDRQHEVLAAAFDAGYYDWPRETDAQTLAADMGIASATLHKHLRAAEQKMMAAMFDGGIAPA